jgi:hypothetical protein
MKARAIRGRHVAFDLMKAPFSPVLRAKTAYALLKALMISLGE